MYEEMVGDEIKKVKKTKKSIKWNDTEENKQSETESESEEDEQNINFQN